ncbi:MAG: M1 family metallopeptidase [Deltaproteobacteria bacterium]|nr:M1 family metallopeptidase [Deltaproteobacteria bacterium]MDQ3300415.1 M1 family metallopeptidase [Myxococcota bacterium]
MLGHAVVIALAVAAIGAQSGCRSDPGAPRVRAMPTLDRKPALRGDGAARSPRIANYKIVATLDAELHRIVATETLTWTNTGTSAVTTLPFHLYLNAFKNESSLFMRSSRGQGRDQMRGAQVGTWGWIQIDSVQVGGVELAPKLVYPGLPDESVVELTLPAAVEPGATVEVHFKFTAQLPEVFARTGYKGEFHMVGQWFPKIGVRVGERWECRPHHASSEFFADFGTYDVELTVPSTYVVAATGVLANVTEAPGGTRTYTYRAEDVHDFAWMADPYMDVMTGHAKVEDGKVEVRVLYRPEQKPFARRHLQAAIGAIERFSASYVPYPWPIMTVIDPPVEAAAGAGGMEYPTLVTTAGDSVFTRKGIRLPEYVTIHEIGHNWFQGLLASNEPVEPWLDEGVDEWASAKVMNDLYGSRASMIDWMDWHAEVVALRRAAGEPGALPSPMATAAYAIVDGQAYGEASYTRTMRALKTLENLVGPTKFAAAMKVYAQTFAFKHPTGRDLFETLSRELGQDLTWFIGPVWHDVGALELGLRTAECWKAHPPRGVFDVTKKPVTEKEARETGSYICEVVVTSTGTVHVPVDIELRFADGSTQRVRWDDRGHASWERFTIERSSRLTEVWIDPDNKVLLDSPFRHQYRVDGEGAASLRAAARLAAIAQTLMQVVGL